MITKTDQTDKIVYTDTTNGTSYTLWKDKDNFRLDIIAPWSAIVDYVKWENYATEIDKEVTP